MPISSARRTCGSSQVLVPAPGEVVRGITGRSRTSGIGFGSQQQHFIPATKTLPLRPAPHISDHRLAAVVHMHMLDADGLRAAFLRCRDASPHNKKPREKGARV